MVIGLKKRGARGPGGWRLTSRVRAGVTMRLTAVAREAPPRVNTLDGWVALGFGSPDQAARTALDQQCIGVPSKSPPRARCVIRSLRACGRTCKEQAGSESDFPPRTDIVSQTGHVGKVPIAEVAVSSDNCASRLERNVPDRNASVTQVRIRIEF
jgi:hypothetical protein